MRTAVMALMLCALLLLSGCVSDRAAQGMSQSAQIIANAAAALPPSPEVTAIEANATAIGIASGYPLTAQPGK